MANEIKYRLITEAEEIPTLIKGWADAHSVVSRKRATLLVLGQSTEQGPIARSEYAAYPIAFESARNPGFMQKRPVNNPNRGGWWAKVYDDLWDHGYDLDILNAAVGGASLIGEITGYGGARSNSWAYYKKRASANYPDVGDFGSIVSFGSKWFVATGGRNRQCFNAPPHPGVVGTSALQDYVAYAQTTEASGTTVPDVTNTAIGDVVSDGTMAWTCYAGPGASETDFYPGIDPTVNGGLPSRSWGGYLGEQASGAGYDPLGIIATADRLAQQAAPSELKIVYFSNGQSDLSASVEGYKRGLMQLLNYFLRRGWVAVIGNTIYSPASSGSTTANYSNQVAAVDNAIAALSAYYPGKVFRGANLFDALGSTGPMGGQKCTGGVSSTTLTISAVQASSGTGIAVGQRVWNGTTLVGIISALGTGTGGTGTYSLDRTATVAAGTALICAGSGLQYDGIHQNGSMVAAGGTAIANSLKAFLPKR